MAEIYVLDTSAWLALNEGEPGADQVEAIIASAWLDDLEIHCSFVTLAELEIIRTRETSPAAAAELIEWVNAQPIHWHHSDTAICRTAAKLKAANKLSFADSFIVALAVQLNATLVHKDPEMAALGDKVKQHILPLKTRIP